MITSSAENGFVDDLTREYNKKGLDIFLYEWGGTRAPREILFPTGVVKQVCYMRDGLIMFMDDTSADYERLADSSSEQPQRILVTYELARHQKRMTQPTN